jgi:hypothetical protein
MTTVWFLLALIAFPGAPSLNYKGYFAYHSLDECEMQRPSLEQFIADRELRKGNNNFYLETYCLEMKAFDSQLEKYKEKQKGISSKTKGIRA